MLAFKPVAGVALAASLALAGGVSAKELTIALASEPTAMDPHFHNLGPNNALAAHIFDSLILTDEKQTLLPGLATSWKPINDTTWEFKLRQGVKFHDGSPFTADDVIFTFKRAPDVEGSPSSFGTYTKGKTLKKIDDHTLQIITERPYPLMPNDVSTIHIISTEKGTGAKTADYNSGKAAIGTGPYKFKEYVPGDRIVFTRNENYWGKKPEWTEVTIRSPGTYSLNLYGPVPIAALPEL